MSADIMESPTVRRIVGPTILLASGNYFDFLAPEDSTFTIDDIAHGLSHICRFAGHCQRFYSVAQHSVLVSRIVPPEDALAGLMHDAAEALVGDVAKPLKDLLPDYRRIERAVEAAVLARFSVPEPLPPSVKEADVVMLATEQRALMRNRDDWNYTRGRQPLDIDIPAMGPAEAKAAFLARYAELTGTARLTPAAPTPAPVAQGETQTADHIAALAVSSEDDGKELTLAEVLEAGFKRFGYDLPREAAREACETIAAGSLPLLHPLLANAGDRS